MHGYQHTAVNTVVACAVAAALVAAGRELSAAYFAGGMMFGTLLVTPDLDLHLSDPKRHWGKLRFIWAPYAAMSRHRGRSHTYVLGPVTRLAYLALWGAPAWMLLSALKVPVPLPDVPGAVLSLAGYFAAQWLHLLCDGILPLSPRAPRGRAS